MKNVKSIMPHLYVDKFDSTKLDPALEFFISKMWEEKQENKEDGNGQRGTKDGGPADPNGGVVLDQSTPAGAAPATEGTGKKQPKTKKPAQKSVPHATVKTETPSSGEKVPLRTKQPPEPPQAIHPLAEPGFRVLRE